jgi:hypothetical protein
LGTEEERLTELNERIGPYKIMPPELERVQTDLDKDDYNNVITFDPIHKLMEESTCEEMGKRISIQKCIEYIELQ